jgi:hypothetical protein
MNATIVLREIEDVLKRHFIPDYRRRDSFLSSLTFLFHTMRASERMLTVAAEASKDDPLLGPYFREHLEEERGHAEWLADDLLTAGIHVWQMEPPQQAMMMCGTVYYQLFHGDPAALLGYMLLMEGRPAPRTQLEEIERLHGKELCRTLRYHAENDVDHARHLVDVVNLLPPPRLKSVLRTALISSHLFSTAMHLIAIEERTRNG